MRGFTPGPWRIGNLESYDAYTGSPFRNVWAGDDDNVVVARCIDVGPVDENARLIAAAPDLLATLREVEAFLAERYRGRPIAPPAILESVRAAIIKARGQ